MPRLERFHEVACTARGLTGRSEQGRAAISMTCGIDWAEAHHDVAIPGGDGTIIGRRRISTGLAGFGELMALLAGHRRTCTTAASTRRRP
jgi:hypothetical protein